MKRKILTTRSKEARKLADQALEKMQTRPPTSMITTSSVRGKKRDPGFISTDMIHPQIRKALGEDEAAADE